MAAPRLSDSQKSELVVRFRAGESTQVLARAYGCSAATVTRTVRAALDPEEYERLKLPAGRRTAVAKPASVGPAEESASETAPAEPVAEAEVLQGLLLEPVATSPAELAPERRDDTDGEDDGEEPEESPASLAIDDADDFGEDEEDDSDEDDSDDGDADEEDDSEAAGTLGGRAAPGSARADLAASLALGADAQAEPVQVRPLAEASLPESAYLLVDKTVELQARPLRDFPEIGPLEADELDRQALVVYLNPRQAKRQCGRSQRVIKIPDLAVLERTSRFLVSQGISRLLIEGSLYSLPGS